MIMNYANGFKKAIIDLDKTNKKDAMKYIDKLDKIFKNNQDEQDSYKIGYSIAKLKNYFAPNQTNKKDDIAWGIQALSDSKHEKRGYCKVGYYFDGLGLSFTDSRRLHICKNENKEKYYLKKSGWLSEEDGKEICEEYPNLLNIFGKVDDIIEITENDVIAMDLEHVGVKIKITEEQYNRLRKKANEQMNDKKPSMITDSFVNYHKKINTSYDEYIHYQIYNRKYYNQLIAGCTDYTLKTKFNIPLYIENDNRLGALMCYNN